MAKFDLVIRGDRVVAPHGVDAFHVPLQGEKILAVAAAGNFGSKPAQRLTDE